MSSEMKNELNTVVGKGTDENGKTVEVTAGDVIAERWRQEAVKLLEIFDPAAYAKYREMKYAGGPNPTHEQRRNAYRFAVRQTLDKTYLRSLANVTAS